MLELQSTHQLTPKLLMGLEEDYFELDHMDQLCEFLGSFPENGKLT